MTVLSYPGPNHRAHFTITAKQHDLLLREAVRTGRSQAQVVRTALDEYLMRGERRVNLGVEIRFIIRQLPRILRRIHPRLSD